MKFYLTGRVQIEGPAGVVTEHDMPGRQGPLMLVRLALARGPVSHDQLADLLWERERPPAWQTTLSPLASRLRGSLDGIGLPGRSMLLSRQGAYELVIPDRWVDVEVAIRSLDRAEGQLAQGDGRRAWPEAAVASAILRRPFLEGENHRWVSDWRATLGDGMVRALAVLAESSLQLERWPLAEAAADEAIRLDPLREVAHRQRIRALLGAGNGARALRAYHELEALLTEELGTAPSAATQALYEGLLGITRPA
ncbi:MAG TPA: bacterial transcriptional activator domain-containing protein [Acidimicrobiia bacterium]|nr:bacterial transcriptional activator domain-containing protein [Acidimicrobiia bacterium]